MPIFETAEIMIKLGGRKRLMHKGEIRSGGRTPVRLSAAEFNANCLSPIIKWQRERAIVHSLRDEREEKITDLFRCYNLLNDFISEKSDGI